jgi:hypothetical protein
MIVNKWTHPRYIPRSDNALETLITLLEEGHHSIALMGYSGCGKHAIARQAMRLMTNVHGREVLTLERDALKEGVSRPPPNCIVTLSTDAEMAVASFKQSAKAWHGIVRGAADYGYTALAPISYERNADNYETTLFVPGVATTYAFIQEWMAELKLSSRFKTTGLTHTAKYVDGNLHVLSYISRALLAAGRLQGLTGKGDALEQLCVAVRKTVDKSVANYEGLSEIVQFVREGRPVATNDVVDLWKIGVLDGVSPVLEDSESIDWKAGEIRLRHFLL